MGIEEESEARGEGERSSPPRECGEEGRGEREGGLKFGRDVRVGKGSDKAGIREELLFRRHMLFGSFFQKV